MYESQSTPYVESFFITQATTKKSATDNSSSPIPQGEESAPYSSYTEGTQPATTLPPYQFSWGGYLQSLSVLFFVLALIVAVLLLLKKKGSVSALSNSLHIRFSKSKNKGSIRKENPLTVEQRYSIDQRKSLLVVQFLNKKLLLGVTESNIQVLEESLEKGTNTHERDIETFNTHLSGVANESTHSTKP